ncbi:hypothetical protein AV530_000118 [Patagioenas fasciata monilis]|uniref:Uncharacterized protein n=1 Tax=Patagioenas fasciata monilis TaxID=372326 RepID=A0A1V4K068_PATFA|nr:hypothetical protein AV530_000118 [Patagioenas fasciata monilis]
MRLVGKTSSPGTCFPLSSLPLTHSRKSQENIQSPIWKKTRRTNHRLVSPIVRLSAPMRSISPQIAGNFTFETGRQRQPEVKELFSSFLCSNEDCGSQIVMGE